MTESRSREVHVYHASAGCGKTSRLMQIIGQHIESGIPLESIAFVTFTRAAADVAKDRVCKQFGIPLDKAPHFRTIHSMCFRALGMNRDRMMDAKKYEDFGIKAGYTFGNMGGKRTLDEVDWSNMTDAQLVAFEQFYRSNTKRAQELLEEKVDALAFTRYCIEYVKYKDTFGFKDFTDLLEDYIKEDKVEPVRVACIDEAQDCSPLQWRVMMRAFRDAEFIYVVGDDKQCQPGDELVLCGNRRGLYYKRLDALDPEYDRLVSMKRPAKGGEWHFVRDFPFEVEHHPYSGDIICVSTYNEMHRYTPDHRCLVRIYVDDSILDKWFVYCIGRKGNYKIGITRCRAASSSKEFGLTCRMRDEEADEGWVLRICGKEEALMYEMLYSYKYGIPQAIFAERKNDWLYEQIDTRVRATALLYDLGMDINLPAVYYNKQQRLEVYEGGTKLGGIIQMYAINLDPRWMDLVQYRKTGREQKGCGYIPFAVRKEKYRGEVYSLNVLSPTHTYVNGELATHNCIYNFAAAESRILTNLKGTQHLLDTSYRVPSKILEFVNKHIVVDMQGVVRTQDKTMNEGGKVAYIANIDDLPEYTFSKSYFFLARNKKFLKLYVEWAEQHCIPYRLLGEPLWSDKEKQQYRDGKTSEWDPKRLALARDYYQKGTFYNTPNLDIETIHGVKGDEADVVVLMSDISRLTWKAYIEDPNDEHKVFYVGCTRAKKELYIMEPQTSKYYGHLL